VSASITSFQLPAEQELFDYGRSNYVAAVAWQHISLTGKVEVQGKNGDA